MSPSDWSAKVAQDVFAGCEHELAALPEDLAGGEVETGDAEAIGCELGDDEVLADELDALNLERDVGGAARLAGGGVEQFEVAGVDEEEAVVGPGDVGEIG